MISDTERSLFSKAIALAKESGEKATGIGTYREKTVHKVLKYFCEPDETFHEIPLGEYIADIKKDNKIIEIQTAGFGAIKKRLDFFLQSNEVTVVYPIVGKKHLVWVDPETGENAPPVKSPAKGNALHILPELLRLGDLFGNGALTIKCALLEVTEYKLLDGWGNGGKRGAHRLDRVPSGLTDIVSVSNSDDVRRLLCFKSGERFSSKELAKACGFSHKSTRRVSLSLRFLKNIKIIEPDSKKGNAIIYRVT